MASWLDPVFDADQMRSVDAWAIEEQGIASLELMETAGRHLAEAVSQLRPDAKVVVVCGGGNNGGDGLVAARHLSGSGQSVAVVMLAAPDRMSADAQHNLGRLPRDVAVTWDRDAIELPASLGEAGVVVDALLGTGFRGEPRPHVAAAIEAINAAEAPVVAADVPSGVDASSGEVASLAVEATVTVSFHAAKIGHLVAPGKHHCGDLKVVAIGIPEGAPVARPVSGRIRSQVLANLARRGATSTKFSSGQVVVVGGSRGLTGAPCLAAMAAIRSGAGYATVAVPADLEPIFEQKLTEVMSVGCSGPAGRLGREAAETVMRACERAAAVVIGPGAGRDDETLELIRELAVRIEAPVVIDADALFAFNEEHLASLRERRGVTILTPHEGEMGRLLALSSASIRRRRVAAAREAAERSGSVVLLKGDDSLVLDSERLAINDLSSPALATAGSGDVLSGVVAALLARSSDPFQAVAAAVYAHARAGRIAADRIGLAESVIASDVIAALPSALRR